MKNYWKAMPRYGKWISSVVGGLAAIWLTIGWAQNGYEHLHTQPEADEMKEEMYQFIADEKKMDRIQRNHRELSRLQRDLIGGKYANDGEKEFLIGEINLLNSTLRCDEEGVCL